MTWTQKRLALALERLPEPFTVKDACEYTRRCEFEGMGWSCGMGLVSAAVRHGLVFPVRTPYTAKNGKTRNRLHYTRHDPVTEDERAEARWLAGCA